MKINSINKTDFKGTLDSKLLLKGLEKIANHPASFCAGVSLAMSLTVRPFIIKNTPKVEDENKKYSIANSISSGLVKFLTVEAIALPVEKAVKKIEESPKEFLNKQSINFYKNSPSSFSFLSHLLKQGVTALSAVPKSLLAVYSIPFIMDFLFNNKRKINKEKEKQQKSIAFKAKTPDFLASKIGNYFNNDKMQTFANNHIDSSKNITRNVMIFNDALLTGLSAFNIKRNKKIKEKRKNNLIYNNILSTGFSIISGIALDKIVQNKSGKLIEKFKKVNASDTKLEKYLQGINILRPTVIFAFVYYGILPFFSNFFAQKISDKFNKHQKNSNIPNFNEFRASFKQNKIS